MLPTSPNFEFLADQKPEPVVLGMLAERYFLGDPSTALVKVRQCAELLAKLVAAQHRAYEGERETFEEAIGHLARLGVDHSEALGVLKLARRSVESPGPRFNTPAAGR